MKRQMYMVNAPLMGYMTDISASACIMRYLGTVRKVFTRRLEGFEHPYIMKPITNPLALSPLVKVGLCRTHQ